MLSANQAQPSDPALQPGSNEAEHHAQDLDDELNARLEAALSDCVTPERSCHDLAVIIQEYTGVDLARASLRFSLSERAAIFDEIDKLQQRVEFLIHVDSPTRAYLFRTLDDSQIVEMIEAMPSDEAVWVMDDLVVPRYRRIMEALDPKKAKAINELAKFDPDSAGRLMTNEFFAFRSDTTISQAANYIRDHPSIDLLRRIFVCDEGEELVGFVPLRGVVVNPPSFPLKRVMRPIAHWVHPDTDRKEVIELFERYKCADLPVVDRNGKLVGVVTYEDIAEAIEDQTDETLSAISGTAQDSRVEDPMWKSIRARAPWLVVTLCAGFVNATNISMFNVAQEVFMFVPLVIGMSGNVGIQCSTLMIRAMSLGIVSGTRKRALVAKEITTAMATGVLFGLLGGIMVYALSYSGWLAPVLDRSQLALIVSLGQIGACLIASIIGVLSPLAFSRMGIDPAVSSGPITTAVNDVMSTIMYFLIAASLTSLLAGACHA